MNRYDGGMREAKIRYLDGDYQVLLAGSHVICAITESRCRWTNCATGAWRGRKPMWTPPPRSKPNAAPGDFRDRPEGGLALAGAGSSRLAP